MAKVRISPLLNSLFSRSDRMTKVEANHLVEVLSVVGGDDVKISLAQSTVAKSRKANYLTIHAKDHHSFDDGEVARLLDEAGWNVLRSVDKGKNEGFWMFFLRK